MTVASGANYVPVGEDVREGGLVRDADGEWLPPGSVPSIAADSPGPASPTLPPPPAAPAWTVAPPRPAERRAPVSSAVIAIAVVTLVVFVGGLLAAYVNGTGGRRKGLELTASPTTIPVAPASTATTYPPATDPVVPEGFTLHRDEAHGYAVAIPDGWIVIDLAAAPSVDAAFAAARQDHPDRAKSLENLRSTITDELLVAVGPLNGALITDLVVSKRPPLHGITSPAFMDSYERALRDTASKTAEPTDLTIYAATIASRPAIRATFHFTQTLTSGATDEAYRYIAVVEGNRSDYALWMNTDTPDESSPIFEQAAGTLTPLG